MKTLLPCHSLSSGVWPYARLPSLAHRSSWDDPNTLAELNIAEVARDLPLARNIMRVEVESGKCSKDLTWYGQ